MYNLQKKNRRIRAALKLFGTKDADIVEFDKPELLSILQENGYHSFEQSDTEDEDRESLPDNKRFLHVYDHPWRSKKATIIYYVLQQHLLLIRS